MTKFEFIKDQKNTLRIFSMIGLTPVTVFKHLEIYEFFHSINNATKMQMYEDTASKFEMQPRQIMNIIKDLEEEINLPPNSKIVSISISQ